MGLAARSDARWGEVVPEPDQELAAWREEIRRHALAQLVRKSVKPPRAVRIGVLLSLLLLLAASLNGLRHAMHIPRSVNDTAVEVRFLDADSPEPPLRVPLVPMSVPRRPTIIAHVAERAILPESSAASAAPPDSTTLQLFNPDGSIRLPPEPALHMPTPLQLSAELMKRGHNKLHCRRTRFAGGYKRDESVGEEISRKYLVWIGLYNADYVERKAARREADAAAACDG